MLVASVLAGGSNLGVVVVCRVLLSSLLLLMLDWLVMLIVCCSGCSRIVSDISVCYYDSERGGTRCGCYACSDALSADGSVGRRSAYPVRLSQVDKIEIAISEIAISVSSYLG